MCVCTLQMSLIEGLAHANEALKTKLGLFFFFFLRLFLLSLSLSPLSRQTLCSLFGALGCHAVAYGGEGLWGFSSKCNATRTIRTTPAYTQAPPFPPGEIPLPNKSSTSPLV